MVLRHWFISLSTGDRVRNGAQLGMKRHNLQPAFRESSDSLRQQAASTNLPMPSTAASGNGVYAWALAAIVSFRSGHDLPSARRTGLSTEGLPVTAPSFGLNSATSRCPSLWASSGSFNADLRRHPFR